MAFRIAVQQERDLLLGLLPGIQLFLGLGHDLVETGGFELGNDIR